MKPLSRLLLIPFSLLFIQIPSNADTEDESFLDFDNIVSELSSSRTSTSRGFRRDVFADILFHSGVAMTTSHLTMVSPNGIEQTGFMKGVEINLGIDLFSKYWLAEGSLRSFGEEEFSHSNASLKEFDLKLTYHNQLFPYIKVRTGGGIAARYLTYTDLDASPATKVEYTTPSSLIYAGIQAELSRMMSLGLELSYRNTMIEETVDKSALDASVRIDAHF